jgi:hypothetical protein
VGGGGGGPIGVGAGNGGGSTEGGVGEGLSGVGSRGSSTGAGAGGGEGLTGNGVKGGDVITITPLMHARQLYMDGSAPSVVMNAMPRAANKERICLKAMVRYIYVHTYFYT